MGVLTSEFVFSSENLELESCGLLLLSKRLLTQEKTITYQIIFEFQFKLLLKFETNLCFIRS